MKFSVGGQVEGLKIAMKVTVMVTKALTGLLPKQGKNILFQRYH
jgi:hypothetical protein